MLTTAGEVRATSAGSVDDPVSNAGGAEVSEPPSGTMRATTPPITAASSMNRRIGSNGRRVRLSGMLHQSHERGGRSSAYAGHKGRIMVLQARTVGGKCFMRRLHGEAD